MLGALHATRFGSNGVGRFVGAKHACMQGAFQSLRSDIARQRVQNDDGFFQAL